MKNRINTLIEENKGLVSKVVFLTKQVSNRDETIQALEALACLGAQEASYEDDV